MFTRFLSILNHLREMSIMFHNIGHLSVVVTSKKQNTLLRHAKTSFDTIFHKLMQKLFTVINRPDFFVISSQFLSLIPKLNKLEFSKENMSVLPSPLLSSIVTILSISLPLSLSHSSVLQPSFPIGLSRSRYLTSPSLSSLNCV